MTDRPRIFQIPPDMTPENVSAWLDQVEAQVKEGEEAERSLEKIEDASDEKAREHPQVYLGDGVYASFDGGKIWLRTEREQGWHVIALEPQVFTALVEYAKEISVWSTAWLSSRSGGW